MNNTKNGKTNKLGNIKHWEIKVNLKIKTAYADNDVAYWVASAYALLGEKDAAFEWLEHSINLGMEDSKWLENDKTLDSLRGDKRYAKLLEHIFSQRA